jgi:hypothetical protein
VVHTCLEVDHRTSFLDRCREHRPRR